MHRARTRDVVADIEALVGAIPGVRRRLPGAGHEARCTVQVAEEDQCLVITIRCDVDDRVEPTEIERRIGFVITTFLVYLNHPLRPRIVVLVGAVE